MSRPAVLVPILACLALGAPESPAAAPDAWAEAAGYFQQYSGSRKPEERASAASRLLAGMDGKHDKLAAALLLNQLTSELAREDNGRKEDQVSGDVLRNCEDSLKKAAMPEAVDLLVREAKKGRSLRARFHLARALGGVKGDAAARALGELIDDKEPLLAVGAAAGLRDRGDETGVDLALKVLRRKDCPWEASVAALVSLEKLKKPDKSMDALIELLDAMKGESGRTKARLIEVLGQISAIPERDCDDPAWWKETWAAKKGATEVPKFDGMPPALAAEFYGIKSRSTRIVFLIDICGGMEGGFFRAGPALPKTTAKAPDDPKKASVKKGAEAQEEAARAKTEEIRKRVEGRVARKKFDDVKHELVNTLIGLDPRVSFGVVWFDVEPKTWKEELVPATWQNKLACIQDLEKLSPNAASGSNFWSALELAFRFTANPQKPDVVQVDRKANYATLLKGPDTFYLISGARPTSGKYVSVGATAEVELTPFFAELNKVLAVRPVALNTIALGDPEGDSDWLTANSLQFIRRLADVSGGDFVHVAPGK